jgi:hypothetical protein
VGNALLTSKDGKDPRPLTHLYGKVIFEDDFSRGLENWDVVVFGKDGTCEIAPPDTAKYARTLKAGESFVGRGPALRSCVLINANPSMGINNVFLGIRSKRPIETERFVLQMQIALGGGLRGEGTAVIMSGIESRDDEMSVIGDKGDPVGGADEHDWEFTPSDRQFGQNSLLCRRFWLHGSGSEQEKKYFSLWTSWESSWYVKPTSKKIVFGSMNRDWFIEKVTVRELGKDE